MVVVPELPELKTEEGYSADIVRTYIPGDICPHNVRTMSAQHLPRETYILREMLCGHISPGIYVRTISFFGFHLWGQTAQPKKDPIK